MASDIRAKLLKKAGRYFSENPEKRFYAVWGAVFAGIVLLTVLPLIKSQAMIARADMETAALRTTVQKMQALQITPQNRDRRLAEIRRTVEMESQRFLKPADMPAVIAAISQIARRHGVALKKVNSLPGTVVPDFPGYVRLPLLLEAEADYFKLGDFVKELKTALPWFFMVEKFRMQAVPALNGRVQSVLEMSFFSKSK